jgi:hypothetical protein
VRVDPPLFGPCPDALDGRHPTPEHLPQQLPDLRHAQADQRAPLVGGRDGVAATGAPIAATTARANRLRLTCRCHPTPLRTWYAATPHSPRANSRHASPINTSPGGGTRGPRPTSPRGPPTAPGDAASAATAANPVGPPGPTPAPPRRTPAAPGRRPRRWTAATAVPPARRRRPTPSRARRRPRAVDGPAPPAARVGRSLRASAGRSRRARTLCRPSPTPPSGPAATPASASAAPTAA